jgi:hypothetical protein
MPGSYMETLKVIINIKVCRDVTVCRLVNQYQLTCCNMSEELNVYQQHCQPSQD